MRSPKAMIGSDTPHSDATTVTCGDRSKTCGRMQLALLVAIPVALFATVDAGRAGDASERNAPAYGAEAKIQYCTDCHGSSGRGYVGFFTMPRLAGQSSDYLVRQLQAFVEQRRGNTLPMRMGRVHSLHPSTRRVVAAHFSQLNPSPFGRAPRELVAAGKRIYDEGIPAANIPACSACHGPDGKGDGAAIPRLAGQLYGYTLKTLDNWNRERAPGSGDPGNVMRTVTQNMSRSQNAAVAAYLSYQK